MTDFITVWIVTVIFSASVTTDTSNTLERVQIPKAISWAVSATQEHCERKKRSVMRDEQKRMNTKVTNEPGAKYKYYNWKVSSPICSKVYISKDLLKMVIGKKGRHL